MTKRISVLAAAAFAVALAVALPSYAQTAAPTGPTISEEHLLDTLQKIEGRVSIPDQRSAVLIQPAGRDWRRFHQETLPLIGALAIIGMLLVTGLFYATRGRIPIDGGRSGKTIRRFGPVDRFAHWTTATSFVLLAITGLNVTYGRAVLMPLMGPDGFAAWSQFAKYVHNFVGFAFMIGILMMFVLWVKDNIPQRRDLAWFSSGGGLLRGSHTPPSGRFNGGQKVVFWITVLGGAALAITGLILLFPFYETGIADMQLASTVHAIIGVLMIAVILAHIYIGSIGMEGAFEAMGTGDVDLNWAREHHADWVKAVMVKDGAPPSGVRSVPAE
jgi:formate dehydrogenase subunit gamma